MRLTVVTLAGLVAACQSFPVSRDVGARCDVNAECNEKCLTADSGWPGGMCTLVCDTDAACPNNTACIVDQGGVCAFKCSVDADCAFLGSGYTCMPVDRHTPDTGQTVMVCHG